nr:phosphatase PAP2 family protein [Sedimentibacter sp.]
MICKIKNDKAIQQIFIYAILNLLFLIENVLVVGKFNIYSPIDDMIPFVPIFIVPYFMWFLFIIFTGTYFLLKSKEDLRKTFLSINLCMIIAIIIYKIFPNYQTLRPEVYGTDFFSQWLRLLQISDSSSSVCPSLHVAISISLYFGVVNSNCFKNKSGVKIFTLILTILICISTVFIKQHSIIDVAAGLLLSVLVYAYVYKINSKAQIFIPYEGFDNAE